MITSGTIGTIGGFHVPVYLMRDGVVLHPSQQPNANRMPVSFQVMAPQPTYHVSYTHAAAGYAVPKP